MQEIQVWSLRQEDPLDEEMAEEMRKWGKNTLLYSCPENSSSLGPKELDKTEQLTLSLNFHFFSISASIIIHQI